MSEGRGGSAGRRFTVPLRPHIASTPAVATAAAASLSPSIPRSLAAHSHVDPVLIGDARLEGVGLRLVQRANAAQHLAVLVHPELGLHTGAGGGGGLGGAVLG